jgi:fructose-bisphosphate aldolase, class I
LGGTMTPTNTEELHATARQLVAEGKGILAADESTGTITKRLNKVGVESTEENRRSWRELFFTADGIEDAISGVILYDETIRQSTADGKPFPELMRERGVIPGIKVDTGAKPLAGSPNEKVTEGLDGLRDRLAEYKELGAGFAKWRAVITIGDGIPTPYCLLVNADALGRYAALCQEAGIVPIVEPEVLMDGDHTIERSYQVTSDTLHTVFDQLYQQQIDFEGMLLKPNMVTSGYECDEQADVQTVAEETLRCLSAVVPAAVPGIVFLSGGQSDEKAAEHLNAMNQIGGAPWALSFSYGRALMAAAMKKWAKDRSNVAASQDVFMQRARANSAATLGKYSADMLEKEAV